MSLLRATVRGKETSWWEMRLLDLDIVVDGPDESAVIKALEETLTDEYHLAIRFNQTPFVHLLRECPKEVSEAWNNGGKCLRGLNLPTEVSRALSAVFRLPNLSQFRVEQVNTAIAA